MLPARPVRSVLLALITLLLAACASDLTVRPDRTVATSLDHPNSGSAVLYANAAVFTFDAAGFQPPLHIDLSTTSDMSSDVYVAFGAGDTSPVTVVDPAARWDKYVCGATLYWRVRDVNGHAGGISEASVCPPNPFSSLGGAFNLTHALFAFEYDGPGSVFTIEVSTSADIAADRIATLDAARGATRVRSPASVWPEYRCGIVLYWHVRDELGNTSPLQEKHVCRSVGFSAEVATLDEDRATFTFRYRGASESFRIDVSTFADMSSDVYVFFGTGATSPIVVEAPSWDKYVCGADLYWRVRDVLTGVAGDIKAARVTCAD